MEKEKQQKITFKIDKIETISFLVDPSKIAPKYSQPLDFNFAFEVKIIPPKKHILFILSLNVSPKSKKELEVGNLKVLVQFSVLNMEELADNKNKRINLPNVFMASLFSIVISTTRGIWAEKVSGTKLHKVIFPLLNPQKILSDLKLDKSSNKL